MLLDLDLQLNQLILGLFKQVSIGTIRKHNVSSFHVSVSSNSTAPSAPPQSVSGVAESSSALSFTWLPPPPVDVNGILLYYEVNIREIETGQSWTFHAIRDYLRLVSLYSYFTYQCEVAAHTVGRGPFSDAIQVQTLETCKNFNISPHVGLNQCSY